MLLLDLDGVVRHFDPTIEGRIEETYGLPPGSLAIAAFDPDVLEPVVTGKVRREDWVAKVGRAVGNVEAAEERFADRGTVDDEMMDLVGRIRALGTTVAVLTNGTDTISEEMVELGLNERFDAIFNSAEIGYAKPDRRAFEHVCEALEVAPHDVFFTDDTAAKLSGALEIGMSARLYRGIESFRRDLIDHEISFAG